MTHHDLPSDHESVGIPRRSRWSKSTKSAINRLIRELPGGAAALDGMTILSRIERNAQEFGNQRAIAVATAAMTVLRKVVAEMEKNVLEKHPDVIEPHRSAG